MIGEWGILSIRWRETTCGQASGALHDLNCLTAAWMMGFGGFLTVWSRYFSPGLFCKTLA